MARQVLLSLDLAPIVVLVPHPVPEVHDWPTWFAEVVAHPAVQGRRILLQHAAYKRVWNAIWPRLVIPREELVRRGLAAILDQGPCEDDHAHPWLARAAKAALPDERQARHRCASRFLWIDENIPPHAIGLSDQTGWMPTTGRLRGSPLELATALRTARTITEVAGQAIEPDDALEAHTTFWARLRS